MNATTRQKLVHIVVSLAVTIIAAVACYIINVPNPNLILFTVMVLALTQKGYAAGIASAVIVMLYTLFFFSENHSFLTFSLINAQKVVVTILTLFANICLVGYLQSKYVGTIRELSEEKLKLEHISKTDPLTNLYNRYAFRLSFDKYRHKNVAVTIFDVDSFKKFNDLYGHDVGDLVLESVATEMTHLFGKEHCYRWGGDEFLVINEEQDEALLLAKLEQLDTSLEAHPIKQNNIRIKLTSGYAIDNVSTAEDLRELIKLADNKLYQSKAKKKACHCENPVQTT